MVAPRVCLDLFAVQAGLAAECCYGLADLGREPLWGDVGLGGLKDGPQRVPRRVGISDLGGRTFDKVIKRRSLAALHGLVGPGLYVE